MYFLSRIEIIFLMWRLHCWRTCLYGLCAVYSLLPTYLFSSLVSGPDDKPQFSSGWLLSSQLHHRPEWQTAGVGGCCPNTIYWWGNLPARSFLTLTDAIYILFTMSWQCWIYLSFPHFTHPTIVKVKLGFWCKLCDLGCHIILLLFFFFQKRLLRAMEPIDAALTDEEKARNRHGPHRFFEFSPEPLGEYPSPQPDIFPDIKVNRARFVGTFVK